MKKYVIALIFAALPFAASASCDVGQIEQSVVVTPAVAEVSHTVHHNAVTHQELKFQYHHWVWVTVTDVAAWDEVVVDSPAIPAVTELQCVTDPSYVPPTPDPVVEPVATPAPVVQPLVMYPGGYSSVCSYVLTYQDSCTMTPEMQTAFAIDPVYRESVLAQWRLKIFGPNYNHQSN